MQAKKQTLKKQKIQRCLTLDSTYRIGNRSFIVEPVFKEESSQTLGEVLLPADEIRKRKIIMTFREAADRESGLCYNIGVQVNLLFDCPKKGASMKQSSNKETPVKQPSFLYERLSRDDNLEGESYSIGKPKETAHQSCKGKRLYQSGSLSG